MINTFTMHEWCNGCVRNAPCMCTKLMHVHARIDPYAIGTQRLTVKYHEYAPPPPPPPPAPTIKNGSCLNVIHCTYSLLLPLYVYGVLHNLAHIAATIETIRELVKECVNSIHPHCRPVARRLSGEMLISYYRDHALFRDYTNAARGSGGTL